MLGALSILLGILFEKQTIAFIVSLTFSIAASSNFPYFCCRSTGAELTTRGAVVGGMLELITAVVLTILSPTVWVQVLGHASAIYPYEYPALFSMLVAFAGIYVFSVTDRSARGAWEREAYQNQRVDLTELGISSKTVGWSLHSPSGAGGADLLQSPIFPTYRSIGRIRTSSASHWRGERHGLRYWIDHGRAARQINATAAARGTRGADRREGDRTFHPKTALGAVPGSWPDRSVSRNRCLYRYFESKEALIERVYNEVFQWRLDWDRQITDRSMPLAERLHAFTSTIHR